MSAKRYILSTGGTGGHIFPAIAVAQEIMRRSPDAEIIFVGAKGGMENRMVPDAGFKIIPVTVSGIARRFTLKNVIKNLSFPFKYLKGLWEAARILRIFKPDVVLGFGGFASAPTLRMAVSMGIPAAIHESNAYPGVVNRMMAGKVNAVLIGNAHVMNYLKVHQYLLTGNPVRSFLANGNREKGLEAYGFTPDKKVLFLTGGSLGARTLNQAMLEGVDTLLSQNIQVIWQCGRQYYEEMKTRCGEKTGLVLLPFIDNMPDTYACADLIISRAGAMTVSEISWLRKPAILVPSPNVAEDHQTRNAESLTSLGAAVLIKDVDAGEKLIPAAVRLFSNKDAYQKIETALENLPVKNAVQEITDALFKLAERRNPYV